MALLEYASVHSSCIVEDDYDSEFRFSGHPIPSLQGLVPNAPVIYIGTFSKTLYPGMRIAYMVLPKALALAFRTAHSSCTGKATCSRRRLLPNSSGRGITPPI